jgi:hypothetical protein
MKSTTENENFVHVVLFWLKNPTNFNDRKEFEQHVNTFLATTKFAKNKHFGVPAQTQRPVVESSYTYCLKVTFDDLANHDNYQTEIPHKLFIAEAAHLWEKVLIIDSEVF